MIPGAITYESPTHGKIHFVFESCEARWENPYSAANEAARLACNGKFCMWNVQVVEGVEVCVNQISTAKFREMRAGLVTELSNGIENFGPLCAAAKQLPVEPKKPPYKWLWVNGGQTKLVQLQAMLKYWKYDEDIWPV